MEREAMKWLKNWKERKDHKPLIIRGARQAGKTWLMKEFGKTEFAATAYINFEGNKALKGIFSEDFDIRRIMMALQIETGIQIDAESTLIIFDEIQEAPGALTSLKYFCENAPHYNIIAAGSMLGVSLHENESFPVGKVEFLYLHPLSFNEFLKAIGQNLLLELLLNQQWSLITGFKAKFISFLRQYYFIGGMPEVVMAFINRGDFNEVRSIQKRILFSYENDFSKHAPYNIVPRIRMLWNSIPSQLARENRKFIYKAVKHGSRAKDYELALSWLTDCGLVHKVNRVTKPGIPLKAYEDFSSFKLFAVDTGLLGAMSDLDVRSLLDGNEIFSEFKGALSEQYVMQELIISKDAAVFYWSSETSSSEIDFIVQQEGRIIPVEVKAEENLHAKSLRTFYSRFLPEITVRTSMSDFRKEDWIINIPLYAIRQLPEIISFKK